MLQSGVGAVGHVWVQQHYAPKVWCQLTTWIYWITRLFHQRIFFSWLHDYIPRWQSQDSSCLNCESSPGSMTHHSYKLTGLHRVQTLTLLKIFGMCWRKIGAVFDPPPACSPNPVPNQHIQESRSQLQLHLICTMRNTYIMYKRNKVNYPSSCSLKCWVATRLQLLFFVTLCQIKKRAILTRWTDANRVSA